MGQEIYLWWTPCYCILSGYSLDSSKKVIYIYFLNQSKKRLLFQGALIPVTIPRMGHLIKNGIRAFLVPWLVSRVKQPCTPWETFHISWYYYPQDHIHAVCRVPPHPDLLARFSSLFAYFHLYCFSLVSFSCTAGTCKALNMPCMYCLFFFFVFSFLKSDSEVTLLSVQRILFLFFLFYFPQHTPSSNVNPGTLQITFLYCTLFFCTFIFSLIHWGETEPSLFVFVFHLSQYSNDLTQLPLLCNEDEWMRISVLRPRREASSESSGIM